MYKLKIILSFFIFYFSLICFAQEVDKERESLVVARKAFDDGFYDVSLDLLERFLKSYPNSSQTYEASLLIGQCYFYQSRFLDALNKFEELLKEPRARGIKDSVIYWIAELNFKGNNFSQAATNYKLLIDNFPESSYVPFAYYSLGWCAFQEGNFMEALSYFKFVQEKYPNQPQLQDAQFKIIECLYNLKDYAGLKEKILPNLKAYSKDPTTTAYLYFYLAEADYYLGNFNEALGEYSQACADSRDEKIQALSKLGLAWSRLKLKRYEEAENTFSQIKTEGLERRSLDILLLGKAILKFETNRVNEAVQIYDELLNRAIEPQVLMQAYLGKADALYNLADYRTAINVYRDALEKATSGNTPSEIMDKLHYGLSWSYLKQGEFKNAIGEFQKIAKTTNDKVVKVSALCQIGDTYLDSGDYQRAQEAYDTILKEYPDSFYSDYVQYQLGLTLLKVMNYDAAILSFLTLKKNYPDSKLLDDATYALGLVYFQKQDYNSSKEVFGKFQDEFKESGLRPQALYLLGTSLYNLGMFNEAIEAFKNIIRLYTFDTELIQKAEYEIADCLYQMGDEKKAMLRFKALRSKYPDSSLTSEIMWWLGEYYYRQGDLTMAARYFSSLIRDFPKSNLVSDAYYALGLVNTEESKYEDAIRSFKKVIELDRTDLSGQAAIAIADIYMRLDKPDLSLAVYKDAIKNYPNLTNLIYPKMADLFYTTNRYDEALDFYRKGLDLVPMREMASLQFKIAEVLQARGNIEEAIEEYLKVTYLYAENNTLAVKALLRVAKIYEDKENFKEAVNIYKRIILMGVEEAKYAQERLDWIRVTVK
jgi:TolA-binding protein